MRGAPDLQAHLRALDAAGLLIAVDRPIDKDTELHPLVRWQFRGGIAEADRKAFLFTRVTCARGRAYDMPVVVGALAASPAIYGVGMGAPVEGIGPLWLRAVEKPIPPELVDGAPCQEIVTEGEALRGEGGGLAALPVPVSTPGFDAAPYLTASNCITRDPETGIQNVGIYRCALKAPDRLAIRMGTRIGGAGGYLHWRACRARGEPMPCAVALGGPPALSYTGAQKLRQGLDELAVAGGILGRALRVARARTVDLLVPADAEIVVEGLIDTEYLEPEAPFGESHGHVALEDYNMSFAVTAITRRRAAVLPSIVSQVTPSESSVIKRVAYEPMFLAHLRDRLGIGHVRRVALHEPLTNLRRVILVQFGRGAPRSEIWRALYGAANLRADCGKYVIAVSEDIDPDNADAILWSLGYRANPARDLRVLPHRGRGHGPKAASFIDEEDSTLLIDATLKGDLPPIALPKRAFMERARTIWNELGLPALRPEPPWFGYSLGDWSEEWDAAAARAVAGDWQENGRRTAQRRRRGIDPETPARPAAWQDEAR